MFAADAGTGTMILLRRPYFRLLFLSMLAVFILAGTFASTASADDSLLNELIARQSTLESVRAKFVQEKYDPLLGHPIKSLGDFYFKPGVGVRWEYDDVLVVYDGSVLYVYSPEMKEVEKVKGEAGFMGPLAFDIKVLSEDYEMKASRKGGDIELDLRPKIEMPFDSMSMIFNGSDSFPTEVSIKDTAGETTIIKFEEVQLNKRVGNDLFVFTPPPGTTVNERTTE